MTEYTTLLYENPRGDIARIWLNRVEMRNAQDTRLLDELNAAFDQAAADREVKVVILAAKGPHFSAGHDLREADIAANMKSRHLVGSWADDDWEGAHAAYCREKEIYEGYCRRWRDFAKPTIASVQGKVIAGGLMLVWPCDFVIASEDALFQDNTMYMGIPGVEYFMHPWELGIRKAKEFLMTGEPITAQEAWRLGMVNQVVKREALEEQTLRFAEKLANKPPFALKLAKEAINAVFSAQGFDNVQRAAFNAHHLAHSHYRLTQAGSYIDRTFMEQFEKKGKSQQR